MEAGLDDLPNQQETTTETIGRATTSRLNSRGRDKIARIAGREGEKRPPASHCRCGGREGSNSSMTRDLGFTYVGPEEWTRISNATQTPTRRPAPVMEPWGHEVTPQAELTEDEAASLFSNLFPPTP